MSGLFEELKRRNVVRVGVAYLVVGWLSAQIFELAADSFGAPDWVMKIVLLALLIGFPVALILAWAFEMTPEGVKKTEEVDADASITPSTGKKLDKLIIGALVLVVAVLVYDRFSPATPPEKPAVATAEPAAPIIEAPEAVISTAKSIAVLPFVNMSSDPEQEYFSDGITEELLNTLAKVPGLLVAARTSVFTYKGQNKDVREIGRELGVATIVEGSVRKAGNDLRITAQLIRVEDGFHLWSETYDRKLVNIFQIQEDIAFAIADALKAPLGLEAGGLVTSRTVNMEAYDLYLRGFGELKQRGPGLADAVRNLRKSIELDPDFGPAWAALGITYYVLSTYVSEFDGEPTSTAKYYPMAAEAAAKALALDPGNALAHQAMGTYYRNSGRWIESEDEYLKALAIDPQSASVLEDYNEFLDLVGKAEKSIEVGLQAARNDPLRPVFQAAAAYSYLTVGRLAEAEAAFDRALALDPKFTSAYLVKAGILLLKGRDKAALAMAKSCPDCEIPDREFMVEGLIHIINGTRPTENLEAYYNALGPVMVYRLFGKDGSLDAMIYQLENLGSPSGNTQFDLPFSGEIQADP
ncbi:MAG: tetratricopeptide repeat protein, partial [Sphingomonadales bacterium]